ncbi:MAG: TatD family hydrolase [Pegethrix bostrychoides GSE-TBD4-15B]|jgi:TatD DNase family protein|uniref:D-aminoacyl-tRNA deacylase n=1 Tax=Pegethrix bostrychoides GSE-TBD4-15B TaxID=2839662 RepID=A0A951PB18_9CYAN|nr:TatD family hydrolase [Pegethrix bostrychoides GSE-TBD4-15B]
MQLVDTHVHLNFDSFADDLAAVAENWRAAGVVRLVHSCVQPSEFESLVKLADQFPELVFAVGLHPLDAEQWLPSSSADILALAQSDPRVVAIGEMGLDFYKSASQEQQEQVFRAQLSIARQLDLPVIIHCRDAAERMAAILQEFWQDDQAPVRGVMHCWSGNPAETQLFLDLGFYISFSGIVTFKNALQVQASAQMVPDERLLIETDCPFLSPVPRRGEKRNQPAYVRHVAEQVARLRQVSLEVIAAQTTANACRLFELTLPQAAESMSANAICTS